MEDVKVQHELAARVSVDGDGEALPESFPGGLVTIECADGVSGVVVERSEEHTSELQSLMRISYAVFCLKKKNTKKSLTLTNQLIISNPSYTTHMLLYNH